MTTIHLLEGDADANGVLHRSNVLNSAWLLGSAEIVRVLEARDYQDAAAHRCPTGVELRVPDIAASRRIGDGGETRCDDSDGYRLCGSCERLQQAARLDGNGCGKLLEVEPVAGGRS